MIHRDDLIVKTGHYSGVVYNLQVEQDESYIAGGLVVHNCAMMPITKSYRELGIDAPEPDFHREMGEDWFLRQNEGVQRTMMGTGVFEGWKAGEFGLSDIPVLRRDDVWGNSWVPSSLGELRGS